MQVIKDVTCFVKLIEATEKMLNGILYTKILVYIFFQRLKASLY